MEREFVPYESAMKLKELGFDEPCFAAYSEDEDVSNLFIYWNDLADMSELFISQDNCKKFNYECLAPTFSQAFRWFREKNFHVNIESYHSLGKHKPFGLSIDYLHESGKWTYVDYGGDADFQTYEEAQERAIEIIIGILEK